MIEDTIKELTASINRLTERLGAVQGVAAVVTAPAPKATKVKAPEPLGLAPVNEPEAINEQGATVITYTPPAAPAPAPAPAAPKKIDLADCTAVAQQILDHREGLQLLRELNRKLGIERISKCPEDKIEGLYNDLTAMLANLASK